ncbi:MAG: patatin-like phospholipase family protein [Glaciimonas sp.]|nr:patatin-like phospholipase family protein [Glaciimonas sp.]
MKRKIVSFALQGGGSHGAFTWGVLDRLLEDGRIDIDGISGASAGAMNAIALAHGYTVGGRDGARQALQDFWDCVAGKSPFSLMPDEATSALDIGTQSTPLPIFQAMLSMARFFSPYQLNPFDINPLRDILTDQIDFDRIRAECKLRLFIAATHVSSGTLKLFRNKQLSVDALLASACLPTIHRAVVIDGESYWDGGLTANPPLFPLLHRCSAHDVMVILLHPYPRPEIPTTADEIAHRLAEMGFSSAFFTELQGLALVKREAQRDWLSFGRLERRLKKLNLHLIDAQEMMSQLNIHSKLNAQPGFIHALRDEGRSRAEAWLAQNFDSIGTRSSFNLARLLPT